MLFKLAVRNMRRSINDYAVYFVTLIIAVIIFYAFNSISDQQIMREIEATSKIRILDLLDMMMNVFSMVVSLVLGFLIIYANQLLVKRRKMEFGIYFTLGMKPGQVSRVLLYETVLVGLASLAIGLVLGIFVSQLLSFVTAALFGITMSDYHFDFSFNAFAQTLLAFVAIYAIVAIFNVIMIHRCKLIDLINASKKNQRVAIRNPWLCLVLFVSSIAILGIAYWKLNESGLIAMTDNKSFMIATVMMLLGTLLFFFSLAGFMIAILTRGKNFYYRKLRPFTLRQIASKINTSFASMWVVCVLLFLAITTFSTGMNLVTLFTGQIVDANPYDASVIISDSSSSSSDKGGKASFEDALDPVGKLKEDVHDWDALVSESNKLTIYQLDDVSYGHLIHQSGYDMSQLAMFEGLQDEKVQIVPISQVNENLQMAGKAHIDISDEEYAMLNNMSGLEDSAWAIVDGQVPIPVPNGRLKPIDTVEEVQLYDFSVLATSMMIAVPDYVIQSMSDHGIAPIVSVVNINMKSDASDTIEDELLDAIWDAGVFKGMQIISRQEMTSQAMGLRMLLTYLAIYIGLVLLIATAAVLAIQLLSLAIDSLHRYRTLFKLGCEPSSMKGSMFSQIVIFFCMPLALAACHCACAISIINGELAAMIPMGELNHGIFYVAILIAIYCGYMIVTYLTSKSMIKEAWVRP